LVVGREDFGTAAQKLSLSIAGCKLHQHDSTMHTAGFRYHCREMGLNKHDKLAVAIDTLLWRETSIFRHSASCSVHDMIVILQRSPSRSGADHVPSTSQYSNSVSAALILVQRAATRLEAATTPQSVGLQSHRSRLCVHHFKPKALLNMHFGNMAVNSPMSRYRDLEAASSPAPRR
jgi:hypothetical protein